MANIDKELFKHIVFLYGSDSCICTFPFKKGGSYDAGSEAIGSRTLIQEYLESNDDYDLGDLENIKADDKEVLVALNNVKDWYCICEPPDNAANYWFGNVPLITAGKYPMPDIDKELQPFYDKIKK